MDLAHFEKLEHKMADITFVDWKTKMWLTTTPFFEKGTNYVFYLKDWKSVDSYLKNWNICKHNLKNWKTKKWLTTSPFFKKG